MANLDTIQEINSNSIWSSKSDTSETSITGKDDVLCGCRRYILVIMQQTNQQ